MISDWSSEMKNEDMLSTSIPILHIAELYLYIYLWEAASPTVFSMLQSDVTHFKFKGTNPPQKSLNSVKRIKLNKIQCGHPPPSPSASPFSTNIKNTSSHFTWKLKYQSDTDKYRAEGSQKSLSIREVEIMGRSICQPTLSIVKH